LTHGPQAVPRSRNDDHLACTTTELEPVHPRPVRESQRSTLEPQEIRLPSRTPAWAMMEPSACAANRERHAARRQLQPQGDASRDSSTEAPLNEQVSDELGGTSYPRIPGHVPAALAPLRAEQSRCSDGEAIPCRGPTGWRSSTRRRAHSLQDAAPLSAPMTAGVARSDGGTGSDAGSRALADPASTRRPGGVRLTALVQRIRPGSGSDVPPLARASNTVPD
jgi:hypothetical protein